MGEAASELDFRILPSMLLLTNQVFIALSLEVEQGYRGPKRGVVLDNKSILWSNCECSDKACILSSLNMSDHS